MLKRVLIVPGIVLGLVVFYLLVQGQEPPARAPARERVRPVRVIEVPSVKVVPRAVGYGYAQPGRVWEAVAEVGGKIEEQFRGLKKGVFVAAGELLFRIEPEQSRLIVEQVRAEIMNLNAQFVELEQTRLDTLRKLEVEQQNLQINKAELQRKTRLWKEGVISQSQLDQEKQRLLTQQNKVETYKGTLNRLPAQKQALEASLKAQESRLVDAQLNLEKTEILAPFDARIAKVHIEKGQAAKTGQVLAVADSIDAAEVEAQVPRYVMKNLIPDIQGDLDMETFQRVNQGDQKKLLNLSVIVEVDMGGERIRWPAEFARIAETDPKTGTLGVVVKVRDPYLRMKPGKRPPLQKNTYCKVILYGKARSRHVVVPRSALHNGDVYRVNSESRMVRQKVTLKFVQGDLAVVASGLKPGDRIVTSDLVPAIEGMLLKPEADAELLNHLMDGATQPDHFHD